MLRKLEILCTLNIAIHVIVNEHNRSLLSILLIVDALFAASSCGSADSNYRRSVSLRRAVTTSAPLTTLGAVEI